MITLKRPAKEHEKEALLFKKEFFDNGEHTINGGELLDQTDSYDEWLVQVTANTDTKTVNPSWVVTDTFFAFDDNDKLIGVIDLRHELNDYLKDFGNCGYSVRPSERRKGYATEMLRLILRRAHDIGLNTVQLSVEISNEPSVKTIIKNGGKYERSFIYEGEKADVYLVDTTIEKQALSIGGIPAIIWGKTSDKLFVHVHGKMSRKEYAEQFARIAEEYGYQTLSFDLPEHGDRTNKPDRCDIWNGIRDLNIIADHAFENWKHVSLFACSLGAYFSLNTYTNRNFEKCLFESPIVDMKWLVEHMMIWSNVTPEQLQNEKEIATPIDTLRWDYYQYILKNPIEKWPFHTSILYARKDNLQPITSIQDFAQKYNATLKVSENSEHPFMAPGDDIIVEKWLRSELS